MSQFTTEALQLMYEKIPDEEHLPEEQQKFRIVKQLFALYLIDQLLSVDELTSSPKFDEYFTYYKKYIYQPSKTPYRTIAKYDAEVLRTHNSHYLDSVFQQLSKKSNITGNIEYCPVKLAVASWMSEYYNKMDLLAIHAFLDDVTQSTAIDSATVMNDIIKIFMQTWLFDREAGYRVALTLSSNRNINISIAHNTLVSNDKFQQKWYHFLLTNTYKEILTIIENHGYVADDRTIESSFGPIIEAQPDEDDDPEYA